MCSDYSFGENAGNVEISYRIYKNGTAEELVDFIKTNLDEIRGDLYIEDEIFDSELLISSSFDLIQDVMAIVFEKRDCLATYLFKHNPEKIKDIEYLKGLVRHAPVSGDCFLSIRRLISYIKLTEKGLHEHVSDLACQILSVIYDSYITKEIDKKIISLNAY